MLGIQFRQLKAVLINAFAHNTYYRALFERNGVTPENIRTLEDFQTQVPFIEKKDLLRDEEEHPPYGSLLDQGSGLIAETHLTSGTSGLRQEAHAYSWYDVEATAQTFSYLFHWAGLMPGDRLFVTLPVGLQTGGLNWKRAAEQYRLHAFMVGNYDADAKLDLMVRFAPHAIVLSPSYLNRLRASCEQTGRDPARVFPDLRVIVIAGEPYRWTWVDEMEKFWAAQVREYYGSTQMGSRMFPCERGMVRPDGAPGMLHNIERTLLFEVLDRETLHPVAPGEAGELVITTLQKSRPLIRYRTGDRVTFLPHTACMCGRPFAGIQAGSVARYDSMLRIKGMNVWPEAVDAIIFSFPEVNEYRALVALDLSGREVVSLEIEVKGPSEAFASLVLQIQLRIRERVGIGAKVSCVPEGTLPRSDFKVKRWHDERQLGPRALGGGG